MSVVAAVNPEGILEITNLPSAIKSSPATPEKVASEKLLWVIVIEFEIVPSFISDS